MPSLSNIKQAQAVKAFVRMGGKKRKSKSGHAIVKFGPHVLSFPSGILKEYLLKNQIKVAGKTEEEFLNNL